MLQVQCNVFEGASGEIALTVGGGLRQLPGLTENFENAALVLICPFFLSNCDALLLALMFVVL